MPLIFSFTIMLSTKSVFSELWRWSSFTRSSLWCCHKSGIFIPGTFKSDSVGWQTLEKSYSEVVVCSWHRHTVCSVREHDNCGYDVVIVFINISSDKSHDLIGHREKGNQAKAFSYINAFSESCLPSQLIKWVTDQTVTGGKISKPNVSTPVALLGKLTWYFSFR